MSAEVELYKGTEHRYWGTLALAPLLAAALRGRIQPLVGSGRLILALNGDGGATGDADPDGAGTTNGVASLDDDLGTADVIAVDDGKEVYRERWRVSDLLVPTLAQVLRRMDPDERIWGYRLRHQHLDGATIRATPTVEGMIEMDLSEQRHVPFTIEPADEPDVYDVDPADLGVSGKFGTVNVLLSAETAELLQRSLPLSGKLEEGGFLAGQPRRIRGQDRYLVEISHVTPAERSGASALHFTFTGDSFRAVHRRLTERDRGEELLGWYHTHLFTAANSALSATDYAMHFANFRRPWQVAGLLNVTARERVLRFFARAGEEMIECPQWIADERTGYRVARAPLGVR